MAKDLIKSFFLFISLLRNRDAMRLNRHITPPFGALGRMLKATYKTERTVKSVRMITGCADRKPDLFMIQ